jgi:hypothetical protein
MQCGIILSMSSKRAIKRRACSNKKKYNEEEAKRAAKADSF